LKIKKTYSTIYYEYIFQKINDIVDKMSSLNTLNFVFDSLIFVKDDFFFEHTYYILSKKLFVNNEDHNIYGRTCYFSFEFVDHLISLNVKDVNIKFKDIYYQIEKIDKKIFFRIEITYLEDLLILRSFRFFKKFTFNAPNNTYLIYDENEKLLIIRFGNYEKYNLPLIEISICQECKNNFGICLGNHKQYLVKCFCDNFIPGTYYPANLIRYDFRKLLSKKVKKLIIISYEYHEFMFDQLYAVSKKTKCKIKYY